MPNENHANPNAIQKTNDESYISQPGIKGILVGSVGLLALLVAFTFALPAGRILFFTGGFLSLVTLVVIALQSVIYSGQWKAMRAGLEMERAKTDPRLRVAEVRAVNFDVGMRPVFIVTIANDGLIAATGVRIHLGVEIDTDKALDWIHDPVVTIPASGKESYFILSSSWLEQAQIEGFNKETIALRVVGFFDYWPVGLTKFCYKYLPWDGERPEDIPQFVPCDFEPRLNTTLHIKSGVMALGSVGVVGVVIKQDDLRRLGNSQQQPQKPTTDNE
jgi:hypothetical protein